MPKTLIIVVFDASKSMRKKKSEVIRAFNSFINAQKQITNDTARLYLLKFNSVVTVVHRSVPLDQVTPLNEHTYNLRGGTALFDAIAEGVSMADRDKAKDEKVICVIITDGEENRSRYTTMEQLRAIITGHEAKGDWKFLYVGVDSERWAKQIGIYSLPTIQYDHEAPARSLAKANIVVSNFRRHE